jgi:hypothetical protein
MHELDAEMRRCYARRAPEYDDWYNRAGRFFVVGCAATPATP